MLAQPPASVAQQAAESLARISVREPIVQAWAHLDPVAVMQAARALDAAPVQGALHGLTVGVKDIMLTQDMPTRYNTNLPCTGAPRVDAACVSVIRGAGALIVGKTQTVEFGAIGRPAPTTNPHDAGRTPGGSSSGSAAAVADGHVALALGTQTGGSIIRPASYCGVYGFKPSWGLVANEGAKSFAPSLDTIGWFARDLDTISQVLEAFDPFAQPPDPRELRIAVCRTPLWAHAREATQAAMMHAAQCFRATGATVSELDLPASFAGLHEAHLTIMRAEGGRAFLPLARLRGDALHPNLLAMVRDLDAADAARLRAAYNLAASCRIAFDDLASSYTAILVPSTPGEAPPIATGTGDYVFNGIWTLLHTPCLNLPLYRTRAGLPVGVTLTGPRYCDRQVIVAAACGEFIRPRFDTQPS